MAWFVLQIFYADRKPETGISKWFIEENAQDLKTEMRILLIINKSNMLFIYLT